MDLLLLRARTARSIALVLVGATLAAGAAVADVNRIVLRVNDRIATLYEFEQRRGSRVAEIQRADLPPERRQRLLAEAGTQTLREMYEELLVLSRADQLDVRVSEREVQAAVERTKAQYGIETEEEFRAALASAGMTFEDLGQQMRRNLMIREVMSREVQQKIELEEEDLRRYYRDHPEEFSLPRRLELREIVISEAAGGDDAARAELASEVRMALLAGEEGAARLAELVEGSQASGPLELGWIERGDLEGALERGVWDLEPGAVSQPIAARGGLHVIEILGEEPARLQPFVDVQDSIREKLRAGKYQDAMTDFLAQLEENSHIVQSPPPEAAGFRIATDRAERDELSGFGSLPEGAPAADDDSAAEPESEGGADTEPSDTEPSDTEPAAAEPPTAEPPR